MLVSAIGESDGHLFQDPLLLVDVAILVETNRRFGFTPMV
jgi:hypothetical protein